MALCAHQEVTCKDVNATKSHRIFMEVKGTTESDAQWKREGKRVVVRGKWRGKMGEDRKTERGDRGKQRDQKG